MNRKLIIFSACVCWLAGHCAAGPALAQPEVYIEKARVAFDKANYAAAVDYLREGLEESPDNAELHYYLGYFLHYLCYDSVPLAGYGREISDEILTHLNRAIELDPTLRNAFYFTGAEYGVRARAGLSNGGPPEVIEQFRRGEAAGGFPPWLIEYGRNTLRSCEKNAILFAGGDADTNPLQYLQFVEKYRTDVTVLPLALLEEPWFVNVVKAGVEGYMPAVSLSWSSQQISSMRPYKWKSNTVYILGPEPSDQPGDSGSGVLEWVVQPNLRRGEDASLLSGGRAVLVDIVRTNRWRRPVYFSMGCPASAWEGLESYVDNSGFALRLLPSRAETDALLDRTVAVLLNANTFKDLSTLKGTDLPRISYVLQNYYAVYLRTIYACFQRQDTDGAKRLLLALKANLPPDVLPLPENFAAHIQRFEDLLADGK